MCWEKIKGESGYTFVSSLVQLVIISLSAQLILLFLLIFYEKMNLEDDRDEMEWVLFTTDLNLLFERAHSVRIGLDKAVYFVDPKSSGSISANMPLTYKIYSNENHVAKRLAYNRINEKEVKEGGYEIILPYINRASFQLNGNKLRVYAVMKSGKVREREFVVTTYEK